MERRLVFISRLTRLPLVDSDGAELGHVVDVVLTGAAGDAAPRVNGFVVRVSRRDVFVSAGRIAEIEPEGVRLRRGAINLRHFAVRDGEHLLAGGLLRETVDGRRIVDAAITPAPEPYAWELARVALARGVLPGRRTPDVVDWQVALPLLRAPQVGAQHAARLSGLHPAEMATAIREMPLAHRRVLAAALQDDRLADLLEELPEAEQVRIVEGLDLERAAHVLEAMEADDAADLLGELPAEQRDALLTAMDAAEAAPVRRLLDFAPDTAGGLMTPEPVVLGPRATVAEALARIRDPDLPVPLAAQVFVCLPPSDTPTGRYVGLAHFQRLLREAPSRAVGRCAVDDPEPLPADLDVHEVAKRLAAYDMVALPVVDADERLLGAVTIDDVLDRLLPAGWRRGAATPAGAA